ncbi:MAG: DIP1984 family protein [Anaerolinea sp.]|nr:DIP1984 family protein [Anaerolinea sp.]
MKLAEALINRADAQKRIQQLRERLTRSAKVQEGETPPEDPTELLSEMERTLAELTRLVKQINRTNAVTKLESEMTMTEALAERDAFALKRNVLTALVQAATVTQSRFSRSEVKYFSTINIHDIQKQIDDVARRYRELDSRIQEMNWQADLIED